MLINYSKLAFRNLKKNKWFSFLNITGLSLGLSVSMLMLTYVIYENSFDKFHENGKQIYRVAVEWGGSSAKMKFACAMPGISTDVRGGSIPEVVNACKLKSAYGKVELYDKSKIQEENFYFSEPELLQMFTLEFVRGEKSSALLNPLSIVISESIASKYFGSKNPIGQTINYEDYFMTVTGVFKDMPKNTHLYMEMIASYSSLEVMGEKILNPWGQWGNDYTYIQLQNNASVDGFVKKLDKLLEQNLGSNMASRIKFVLHNLEELHWFDDGYGERSVKGRKIYTYIFLSASFLVLLISCFNFMNLSTARYLDKFKEVGIRKVVGAPRIQLVYQFMVESLVVLGIALSFGLIVFLLLYRSVYNYLGTEVIFNNSQLGSTGLIIASLILVIGVIAGSYPALFLSGFNPVDTIKRNMKIHSKYSFRQISTILQFCFSILLLFAVLVVNRQLEYVKTTDIGIAKDDVLMIFTGFDKIPDQNKYETFKSELERNPQINGVTGAYTLPGISSRSQTSIRKIDDPANEMKQLQVFPVDYDFINTLGIKLIAGRTFSREFSNDGINNIIINQTAADYLGFSNPVGQKLIQPREDGDKELTIVGVVKDFHLYSLQNKVAPIFIVINPANFSIYAVNINKNNQSETITYIKDKYNEVFPGEVFNYQFISDAYNKLYSSEEKTLNVIFIFTFLSLVITSIGIIGFASYLTNKKIKEIGIRKIVGASVGNILLMIYRQFVFWVLLAFVLFIPAGYYFSEQWLKQYEYRESIGTAVYLLPLLFTLSLTVMTISFQSVKAATANPVISLKNE